LLEIEKNTRCSLKWINLLSKPGKYPHARNRSSRTQAGLAYRQAGLPIFCLEKLINTTVFLIEKNYFTSVDHLP